MFKFVCKDFWSITEKPSMERFLDNWGNVLLHTFQTLTVKKEMECVQSPLKVVSLTCVCSAGLVDVPFICGGGNRAGSVWH